MWMAIAALGAAAMKGGISQAAPIRTDTQVNVGGLDIGGDPNLRALLGAALLGGAAAMVAKKI